MRAIPRPTIKSGHAVDQKNAVTSPAAMMAIFGQGVISRGQESRSRQAVAVVAVTDQHEGAGHVDRERTEAGQ
jgi:hypothetical protein